MISKVVLKRLISGLSYKLLLMSYSLNNKRQRNICVGKLLTGHHRTPLDDSTDLCIAAYTHSYSWTQLQYDNSTKCVIVSRLYVFVQTSSQIFKTTNAFFRYIVVETSETFSVPPSIIILWKVLLSSTNT